MLVKIRAMAPKAWQDHHLLTMEICAITSIVAVSRVVQRSSIPIKAHSVTVNQVTGYLNFELLNFVQMYNNMSFLFLIIPYLNFIQGHQYLT